MLMLSPNYSEAAGVATVADYKRQAKRLAVSQATAAILGDHDQTTKVVWDACQ